MNSWVENVTSGLINELLPSGYVDHNTRLVFGNALYFKGAWDKKFDATKTTDSDFHLLDGRSLQVPFMTGKDKQLLSAHNGFKVLGLPYKKGVDGGQFSMYLFLPDARDGLWSLSEKLKKRDGHWIVIFQHERLLWVNLRFQGSKSHLDLKHLKF